MTMKSGSVEVISGTTTSADQEKQVEVVDVVSVSDNEAIPKTIEDGADMAMQYADMTKGLVLDEASDKRIRRKIDTYVMPFMALMYGVMFLDRSTTSYAAIMGLIPDLKMDGNKYNWTGTAFFLGYMVFAFPGSFSLQKLPVTKTVGFYVFIWGFVLTLHAAAFNYASFLTARTFLGAFESPLLPGLSLIANNFYKKEEMFARTCFYFSFTGLANICGSVVAYGIQQGHKSYTIESWRVMFLILGLVTMTLAVCMVLVVPDVPTKAWWLSKEDRLLTVERIRGNEQGFGSKKFKWYQAKEAFMDLRIWIYFMLAVAIDFPNSGVNSFASILMKNDFGYDTEKALLMKAPMGVVQLVGLAALGFINYFKIVKHPLKIAVGGLSIALMGGSMCAFSSNRTARLAGFYLIGFSPISLIIGLSGLSANTAGRSKKVIANGIYLVGFCWSSAAGPQTFRDNEAPTYRSAKICIVSFYSMGIVLLCFLAWWNRRENLKRDREREALGDSYKKIENSEFADLTDFENRDFRYVW